MKKWILKSAILTRYWPMKLVRPHIFRGAGGPPTNLYLSIDGNYYTAWNRWGKKRVCFGKNTALLYL